MKHRKRFIRPNKLRHTYRNAWVFYHGRVVKSNLYLLCILTEMVGAVVKLEDNAGPLVYSTGTHVSFPTPSLDDLWALTATQERALDKWMDDTKARLVQRVKDAETRAQRKLLLRSQLTNGIISVTSPVVTFPNNIKGWVSLLHHDTGELLVGNNVDHCIQQTRTTRPELFPPNPNGIGVDTSAWELGTVTEYGEFLTLDQTVSVDVEFSNLLQEE